MTEQEHILYHERRYTMVGLLLGVNLVALPWVVYAFDSIMGAQVLLLPTIPLVMVAIVEWISSHLPFKSCSCRWRPL